MSEDIYVVVTRWPDTDCRVLKTHLSESSKSDAEDRIKSLGEEAVNPRIARLVFIDDGPVRMIQDVALRPAEGLPTWREWVEIAISHDHHTVILRGGHTPYRVSAMTVFDIDDCEADQLCAALGRDPKTGWKAGEE